VSGPSAELDLLVLTELLLLEQKERHEYLARRRQDVDAELRMLHREILQTTEELKKVGRERVEFGDLRRLTPVSPVWGLDRGIPLDRYYIHSFLDRHRKDIRGRVLEVKDSGYTQAFGDDRVTVSDVLDVDAANPHATIVADLSRADTICDDTYDCFVLTQTLGVIFDVAEALRHAVRILKPGGVLLCTVPATGRISYEEGLDGDFWRFTEASVRRLFAVHFSLDTCEITGHGNVLSSAAFLYGLTPDELTAEERDTVDPFFPLVYTIRAVKPGTPAGGNPLSDSVTVSVTVPHGSNTGVVLTYHRIADRAIDPHDVCVSVDDFREQMRYLRNAGYRVTPLHDLVRAACANQLDGRSIALTFDDGYVESLTNAALILSEYELPATFFLVGGTLNGLHEFWWDTLERVFFSGHALPDRLSLPVLDSAIESATSTVAERAHTHRRLVNEFYRLEHAERLEALSALEKWSGIGPRPPGAARPMTADEIRRLATLPGVSVGAHSQHHLWLPVLSTEQKRLEVESCKAQLEELVGCSLKCFSYPYGAHDAETERVVRVAGFEVAVTTLEQSLTLSTNPFLVPRFTARSGGASSLRERLSSILSSRLRSSPP
jgi:peptidoglycan/xylan/chitin deacetylase (PgdA/CDA1 family)